MNQATTIKNIPTHTVKMWLAEQSFAIELSDAQLQNMGRKCASESRKGHYMQTTTKEGQYPDVGVYHPDVIASVYSYAVKKAENVAIVEAIAVEGDFMDGLTQPMKRHTGIQQRYAPVDANCVRLQVRLNANAGEQQNRVGFDVRIADATVYGLTKGDRVNIYRKKGTRFGVMLKEDDGYVLSGTKTLTVKCRNNSAYTNLIPAGDTVMCPIDAFHSAEGRVVFVYPDEVNLEDA